MDSQEGPTHTRSGRLVKRKFLHEDLVTPEFALQLHESGESYAASTNVQRRNSVSSRRSDKIVEDDFDEDAESDTDPGALYCVCRQPYNKRFMIACDLCNEWFHGACVGVTKQQGRRMEELQQKWVCASCGGAEYPAPAGKSYADRKNSAAADATTPVSRVPPHATLHSRTNSTNSAEQRSTASPASSASGSQKPDSNNSNKQHNADRRASQKSPTLKKSRMHRRCIKCNRPNPADSIYCGASCVQQHAADALDLMNRYIRRRSAAMSPGTAETQQAQLAHVHVVEPHTGIELNGKNNDGAPLLSELKGWLLAHPTFTIRLPRDILEITTNLNKASSNNNNSVSASKAAASAVDEEHLPDLDDDSPQKPEKIKLNKFIVDDDANDDADDNKRGGDPIRRSVRTALNEALAQRWNDAKHLPANADLAVSEQSIAFIASRIERRLFKHFGDAGQKYKSKYRAILLNIKDKRNETFYRAILAGDVSPRQIALLTSEEMASSELKKWREEEAKNYLELQKKSADELAQMKIVKKTHKGDLELVALNEEKVMRDDKLPDYVPPQETDDEADEEDASDNNLKSKQSEAASSDQKTSSDAPNQSSSDQQQSGQQHASTSSSNSDDLDNITSRRVHMGQQDLIQEHAAAALDSSNSTEIEDSVFTTTTSGVGGRESIDDVPKPDSATRKRKLHVVDTTAEHGTHAFSTNCKICTGQQSETGHSQAVSRTAFVFAQSSAGDALMPDDDDERDNYDDDLEVDISAAAVGVRSPLHHDDDDISFPSAPSDSATSTTTTAVSSSFSIEQDYDPANAGLELPQPPQKPSMMNAVPRRGALKLPERTSTIDAAHKINTAPSATTTIATALLPKPPVWTGSLHYHDVGSLDLTAQHLNGNYNFMRQCMRPLHTMQVIGRIGSADVFRHFHQIKRVKEHGVMLLSPASPAAASMYRSFVEWFCAKQRLAVMGNSPLTKDVYMIPINADNCETTKTILMPLIGAVGTQHIDTLVQSPATAGALVVLVISKIPYGQANSALASTPTTKVAPAASTPPVMKNVSSSASLLGDARPPLNSEFSYEMKAVASAATANQKIDSADAEYDPSMEDGDNTNTAAGGAGDVALPLSLAELIKFPAPTKKQPPPTKFDAGEMEYSPDDHYDDVEMTDLSADENQSLPDIALPPLHSSVRDPRAARAGAAIVVAVTPSPVIIPPSTPIMVTNTPAVPVLPPPAATTSVKLSDNSALAGVNIEDIIGKLLACQSGGEMTQIFKALPSAEARRLLVEEMNRRVEHKDPAPSDAVPIVAAPSSTNSLQSNSNKLPLLPDPAPKPVVAAVVADKLPWGDRRRPGQSADFMHSSSSDEKLSSSSSSSKPRINSTGVPLSRYGVPVTLLSDRKQQQNRPNNSAGNVAGGGVQQHKRRRSDADNNDDDNDVGYRRHDHHHGSSHSKEHSHRHHRRRFDDGDDEKSDKHRRTPPPKNRTSERASSGATSSSSSNNNLTSRQSSLHSDDTTSKEHRDEHHQQRQSSSDIDKNRDIQINSTSTGGITDGNGAPENTTTTKIAKPPAADTIRIPRFSQ